MYIIEHLITDILILLFQYLGFFIHHIDIIIAINFHKRKINGLGPQNIIENYFIVEEELHHSGVVMLKYPSKKEIDN